MESYADIQSILKDFGEVLTFKGFTILGIPSFYTEILNGQGTSPYPVEQQAYNFQVSLQDCVTNKIKADDKFTMSDTVYVYTYQINNPNISYQDGWGRLFVDTISRKLL
jgi:hypothetical protein